MARKFALNRITRSQFAKLQREITWEMKLSTVSGKGGVLVSLLEIKQKDFAKVKGMLEKMGIHYITVASETKGMDIAFQFKLKLSAATGEE